MSVDDTSESTISRLRRVKTQYDAIVGEVPWLRALGPVFSLVGVFILIVANLPSSAFSPNEFPYFWPAVFSLFIFLYLLLAAVYANDRLRTERQLRQVESGFDYDSRGTLWNGGEPNIAFRITTFKGILAGLNSTLETADLSNAMMEAGRDAASNFAQNFGSIYESDIRSKKGGSQWSNLRLSQKLHEWAEYDSSTGWGILAVRTDQDEITIEVVHLNGLYEGEGGQLYGHFISGYCETVVSQLVDGHTSGQFANCNDVVISKGPVFEGETATLTLVPAQ